MRWDYPCWTSTQYFRSWGIIIVIIIIIIIIILFVYLSIFITNEFLLATVNKNFSDSFKIQNQSSRSVLLVGRCSADVPGISGGVSVHGCNFNKVARRLFWDRAAVLVFSCGFTSCLGLSSLENTSGGLLLNGDNFIYSF